jgi:oxygen-dependent protoporphyrinogen oxidase
MAPVTMVAAGYRREDVANSLEGFGFLVPRKEGLRTLGTIWNSSLFPERAPAGHVSMTSFAGGATDPEIAAWPDDQVAATVHAEMARVLRIRGTPVLQSVRRYDRALPQYNLGHPGRIAAIEQACHSIPGLFVAGNYLSGPSFGACIERAFAVADEIAGKVPTNSDSV